MKIKLALYNFSKTDIDLRIEPTGLYQEVAPEQKLMVEVEIDDPDVPIDLLYTGKGEVILEENEVIGCQILE